MKTVKIINGTYGYKPEGTNRIKPVSVGGVVCVPDKEADRLVKLRVADYIADAETEIHSALVATPFEGDDLSDAAINPSGDESGTEGKESSQEDDEQNDIVLDIVDGHFDKDSLMQLTRTNMEKMAAELGFSEQEIKACRNKNALADMIAQVEVAGEENEDGEQPPSLEPEAPVT